jgi:antitoxin CptB
MTLFQREAVAAQGRLGHETGEMNILSDDVRRKRLLWRATHRGIKEMDLILGGFVTRNIAVLSEADLMDLERIMEISDQDMLSWATKQGPIPAAVASPLLRRILDHKP